MSITTKTGDGGQTSLFSGERVWKDDLRVDAYGTLDELDAHIGEAKHVIHDVNLRHILIDIQKDLYRIMGQLSSKDGSFPNPLKVEEAEKLTELVHDCEHRVNLQGFVLPGSTTQSAKLDVCRTIARRAERRIITLSQKEEVPEAILSYVNRLSDFFFIMARWIEKKDDAITYVKL
jgi:cob(I)alamin adenosyltransferase